MTRLAPSELVVLIDPKNMWGWDTVRADLAAFVLDGWAEVVSGTVWLTYSLRLFAPRDAARYPAHVLALHDVLARAAGGDAIGGARGNLGNAIERSLNAAWPGFASTYYTFQMAAGSLVARGLLRREERPALFGLTKQTDLFLTPAGEQAAAALRRRLDAAIAMLPGLIESDPDLAVAIACSLGIATIAAKESQAYRKRCGPLFRAAKAAAARQGPLPPLPAPFALQSGEEVWAALAPPPLTPAGLAALTEAMRSVEQLGIAIRS